MKKKMGEVVVIPPTAERVSIVTWDFSVMEDKIAAGIVEAIGGGYMQAIMLEHGVWMYMDEEGKLKGMPHNPLATVIARPILFNYDAIVGPAVIIGQGSDGECVPLRPEYVRRIRDARVEVFNG